MLEFAYYWLAVTGISEVIISIIKRSSKSTREKAGDQNSLLWIWVSAFLGATLSILGRENSESYLSSTIPFEWIGLCVAVVGAIFRWLAIALLKKAFTVDLSISIDHKLRTDGLYTYVRHPSYLGLFMNFMGIGIALNNAISLVVLVLPISIALVNRIRIEERLLTENFGEDYLSYKDQTWALLPFVY